MVIGKTFKVSLDMKAPTAQRNEWEVVEGDNGNEIEITLTDDGTPVDLQGCKVLAVFGLPTGQTVEQDTDEGSVTIGGTDHNVITIALKTGSFSPGKSSSGLMKCEIQVYSGDDLDVLVTSAQFTFRCRRAIINDETIAATDDYPILVELISEVEQIKNEWQADWTEADPTDHAYIKNKPATMPPSSHTHGKINNDGTTSTTYSHEALDYLMLADYSDSGRIMRSDITLGQNTDKWLDNTGAWTTPKLVQVDIGSFSGLPVSQNDSDVKEDMVLIHAELSDPAAQAGDWTVTTSNGNVTVSGTINGTTSMRLILGHTK